MLNHIRKRLARMIETIRDPDFGLDYRIFGIALLMVSIGYITSPIWAHASDVRIVDGDTLFIGKEEVRLLGIDTPEEGNQADCVAERMLAQLATKRLKQLVTGAEITLERDWLGGMDERRTLAFVYANGIDVGEVLVAEGYARTYVRDQVDWCAITNN